MADWFISSGHTGGKSLGGGSTRYASVTGRLGTEGTEAYAQVKLRDSYTLSKLFVRVTGNSLTGATTVRSRKNSANGAQSVSIDAGATGIFVDDVNSDSLASGDYIDTQIVTGAGTTMYVNIISYKLSGVPILVGWNDDVFFFDKTRYPVIIGSPRDEIEVEAYAQYTFRASATLSYFRVYISDNILDGATTFRTRVNGGNGNLSVSVPATTTGEFEDNVNSDSISPGDLVNYQVITGGTGLNMTPNIFQVKSASTGRQTGCGTTGTTTRAADATAYVTPEGDPQCIAVTEYFGQSLARTDFSAKNLFVRLSDNSLDGSTTIRTRKNGANGNLSVSISSGQTGAFEDTSNRDSFAGANFVNFQVITGGSSGTIRIQYIAFEQQEPVAAGIQDKSANMSAKLIAGKLL